MYTESRNFSNNFPVEVEPMIMRQVYLNDSVSVEVKYSHVDELRLALDNETIATASVATDSNLQTLILVSENPVQATGFDVYTVSGYLNSTLLFSTHREFRYVPRIS